MNPKRKVRTTEDVLKDQQRQADGNTAMVKKAANALATDDSNPWIEVSTEIDKVIGAPMCKFTKQGEFSISDIDNIPDGTRCIAHADEIRLGWQEWVDGKPFDRCAGRVADGFVPPPRSELGNLDERQWELQDDGSRRDPLQFFMEVPITRLDAGGEIQFQDRDQGRTDLREQAHPCLWPQGAGQEGARSADRGTEGRPLPASYLREDFLPGDAHRGLDRRRR